MATVLLFPSGLALDASDFILSHAGETPTTLGIPALLQTAAEARVSDVERKLMARAGVDLDGIPHVRLSCGLLVPLDDVLVLEAAEILDQPWEPVASPMAFAEAQ